ncbi:MAG: hypothetical protein MZV64_25660 [Ignavibacteriales bacterium]|nr:hypothetical protein [Ignavibacteriales bacterium]
MLQVLCCSVFPSLAWNHGYNKSLLRSTPFYRTVAFTAVGISRSKRINFSRALGFKISALHLSTFWTPDVYEGAPIAITAYLSVADKAAGFALLIGFIKDRFPSNRW